MPATAHPDAAGPALAARRMLRLHRVSALAEWVTIGAIALLASYVVYLAFHPLALAAYVARDVPGRASGSMTGTAALLSLVPIVIFMLALWEARRLFRLLSGARIFDPAVPRLLTSLASLAGAAAIAGSLVRTLVVLLLTSAAAQKQLVIGISSEEIAGLIMGLLFFSFALVIQEAIRIEQENRGFV